jgi:hypothetical protein
VGAGHNRRGTYAACSEKTMLQKVLMSAFALALLPSVSFAQTDAERQRQDRACRSDVTKHCRKVVDQGDMVIGQCLVQNEKKLSRGCKKLLEDSGQL